MGNVLGLFGAGLGGGAKAYGKFKEEQTKFEQEEFARNAEMQRKENFARFSYDIGASERARKAKHDETMLDISQQNATTQAASQVATSEHYKSSDALAASTAKSNQKNKDREWGSRASVQYGKMPDGSIRVLTNDEVANKEIPRATAVEAAQFASTQKGKMEANTDLTKQGMFLEDGITRMRKTDTSPEKMDQIEDAMRLTNIADPVKALEVAYGKPKTIPTERWNAAIKAVVESNKLSNEDITTEQFKKEVVKMVSAMGTQVGGAPAVGYQGDIGDPVVSDVTNLAYAEKNIGAGSRDYKKKRSEAIAKKKAARAAKKEADLKKEAKKKAARARQYKEYRKRQ